MARSSFSNWLTDQPIPSGVSPFMGPPPLLRDKLDAARMAWRTEPSASYPSGYLGTVNSRWSGRADLVNNAVWRDNRSYTRGVHACEKLDMSDYLWPAEFNLMSGIEAEARGERFVSPGIVSQVPALVNDGKPGPMDLGLGNRAGTLVPADPEDARRFGSMLPPWT